MKEYNTKYGLLCGVTSAEFYEDGSLKECILDEKNEIKTLYGTFIPQYEQGEIRRKYNSSISFYENGSIKVINLNNAMDIKILEDVFSVEKITFYETGEIKRIFHLNGKLSGYWGEEDEYELAKKYKFNLRFGNFESKFMSLQLYKNQKVKSISFWPGEKVEIKTNFGLISIRTGISLYEDGSIKSCEPEKPISIETLIGKILAYDISSMGIHGENNSLSFYEDGSVRSLVTSTDCIEIKGKQGESIKYTPSEKTNLFNNSIKDIVPVKIEFSDGKIFIMNHEYDIDKSIFNIVNNFKKIKVKENGCTNCELKTSGIQLKI
ncbi:hypothetical protein [Clostridium intestinale]|uniref:MORN repeat variant n=1 Tax=Clostridium intestinale DSM 6191 TaxID=1121320 RepID=A0A1M6AQ09_9CLOT|nr:hypothetical protein [Clostridium intestinale]SHI38521.1 hypothetical protein SAMN02745941_03727 [Clostridium intestinale DSM 6191]